MEAKGKFTKSDCGRKMTREESRKVQLDMLDALVDFCEKHGLRYYLSGGTLLGAVRHKGFIPWDDDIDVNMPRPDCTKLMNLTKGRLGKYRVAGPDMNEFSMGCESFRLYNFSAVVESYSGGATRKYPVYYPLYIDIFPIEGLPNGNLMTNLHYLNIVTLRKMQRSSGLEHMMGKDIFAHAFHVVSRIPARLVGYRRWSQMIQKTAMKYDFNKQEYVGVMTAPIHTVEEKIVKKDYMKVIEVSFEGKQYHAPGNYDTYLKQLYGENYMQLPPIKKQQSHHTFNMYWRKHN